MKSLFLIFLFSFVLFSNVQKASAKNLVCADVAPSCLKQRTLEIPSFPYPMVKNLPAHGIRMVMINDEMVLLKLSFPRLQYRDLCQQLGITFRGKSLRL